MLTSTDASIFEITPKEVTYPKDRNDLIDTIRNILSDKKPFTMRAGGTSIGGQAIGSGVLVDISKHLNNIVDFFEDRKEIIVEPGVIQDDLNSFLQPYNLKFAPDTSTSNRAMIGGMIGNNSCGSYSVFYGTTRDHVKSVEVILSDGSLVIFEELNALELDQKLELQTLEGSIYRYIVNTLNENQSEILNAFPDESLIRRNTGYALDELIRKYQPFNNSGKNFNLAPLLCGSEGTLGVIVSAKLNLVNLPTFKGLIVSHFDSDQAAFNLIERLLEFNPSAVEYVDKHTLDASKDNIQQAKNRTWINGDPKSVLIIEFFSNEKENLESKLFDCKKWLLTNEAYYVGLIDEYDYYKVWEIRKAGLGLLMGRVGAKKAVAVIEDAAIPLRYLYEYYKDIKSLMRSYDTNAVYYGHASVGLIHIRPELDLSNTVDKIKLIGMAKDVSQIVKKYKGSLSGEHGDGRIRAPFLKDQFGQKVYQILVNLKNVFDPDNLLNPGVIISSHDMDILTNIREVGQPKVELSTALNWDKDISFFYAVEKCNGAGVCRKSVGRGVMCPSYKATRDEKFSTRGRANLLRSALSSEDPIRDLKSDELYEALDLCLSCKACKSECPANVDMARLKSEYLFQTQGQQDQLQLWYIKNLGKILKFGARNSKIFNYLQNNIITKKIININRNLPEVRKETLIAWWNNNKSIYDNHSVTIWVVSDLFTQYYDVEVGKGLLTFLKACNVNIRLITYDHSIIAMISHGLLLEAKHALQTLQSQLENVRDNDIIVGIEPSEVLVWRDEANDLIEGKIPKVLLFEELLLKLKGQDLLPKLRSLHSKVWVHAHCHQKALTGHINIVNSLKLIPGIKVEIINSGCCGMAGDFGYKHSEISEVIAHQSFDAFMSKFNKDDIMIATGTSCRRQISDIFSTQSIHLSQIFVKTIIN